LGTTKQGESGEKQDDKVLKKRIELIEAQNNAEMAAIKKRHLEGKTSEDQYNAELLMQEMKFLADKAKVYKVGSKEYEEAQMQLLEKQVAAEKTVKDLFLKAQQELAGAKIDNLKDGIDKEKALQEQRYKEEINALKKQLLDKAVLSDQEIALNDTINQTIEAKKAAHLKAMSDLDKAGALQKQMDAAIIAEAKSGTDAEYFAAQRQLAQAQYEQEIQDANGNAAKIAQAERGLSEKLIQIKLDELDKRQQIGDAVFGAANNLFGGLSELAGKESALGKALFLFQQAAAIGQIIFNTAIANSKAVAQFPITLGQPWVTINTASAVGSIASVVAQSIKGFAGGGFTDGDRIYRAGEKGKEWISPNWMIDNPVTGPIIANLEDMRKNPVTVTQAAVQASKRNGSQGGDSTSSSDPELVPGSNPIAPTAAATMSDESLIRWEKIADRFESMEFNFNFTEFEKIQKRRALREKQSKL